MGIGRLLVAIAGSAMGGALAAVVTAPIAILIFICFFPHGDVGLGLFFVLWSVLSPLLWPFIFVLGLIPSIAVLTPLRIILDRRDTLRPRWYMLAGALAALSVLTLYRPAAFMAHGEWPLIASSLVGGLTQGFMFWWAAVEPKTDDEITVIEPYA
jgi:hypothetical protein